MNPMYANSASNVQVIISGLVSLSLMIWFVVFTVLVVKRLGRIIELLSKK